MPDGNDIQIGNSTVGESTKISFTVKTGLYIIGGILFLISSLFTWFYFDGRAREKAMKVENEKFRNELKKDMKEFENEIKRDIGPLSQNILQIVKEQGEIKGDIKVILNKQLGLRNTNNHPSEVMPNNNSPISPSHP